MQRYRLKISQEDFDQLRRLVFADLPKEAGAFLLAGSARCGRTQDILVRRVVAIPREELALQQEYRLEVSSKAINGLIALCESNGLGAVLCHSHPEAIPYSLSDNHGEQRIFNALRPFIPPEAPTASLLLHPQGQDARVWLPDSGEPAHIDEVVVLGRSMRSLDLRGTSTRSSVVRDLMHSRQVLAFGEKGQEAIASTKAAVVGVGGTGSCCAEQLVRLGVRDLVLVDYDRFEPSNISRMYGSVAKDLRQRRWWLAPTPRWKINVVARHLRRINPHLKLGLVQAHVAEDRAARKLADRDVVFLCTDDHWGRSVVNQLCYQYLIPVINLGVRIDSKEGAITAANGGVDVLRPGLPCLWCKQFLSSDRIAAESMPPEERAKRSREGYVEGLDTPAPSVISLNTTLAGLAVTAFLELVTDFMGEQGAISRLGYDVMRGTVIRGTTRTAPRCTCSAAKGFGDLKPLMTVEDLGGLYG